MQACRVRLAEDRGTPENAVGAPCPRALTSLAAKYFDAQQILRDGAYAKFESFLSQAAELRHDVRCYDDVLGFVAEVRDRSRREQRIANAFPRAVRDPGLRQPVSHASGNGPAEGLRFVHRDSQTGEDYLKISVPSAEVLDRALQALGALKDRFRR